MMHKHNPFAISSRLACTLLGLVAMSLPSHGAEISRSGRTIEIRGVIELGDAKRYVEARGTDGAFKWSIDTVRISSMGGSLGEAARIAHFIGLDEPTIVVDGPCVSACALAIFPASAPRQFERGGFLAFQGADDAKFRRMTALLSGIGGLPETAWRKDLLANSYLKAVPLVVSTVDRLMKPILVRAGADADITLRVAQLTSPNWCAKVNETSKSASLVPEGAAPWEYWIPDEQGLREVGLSSSGLSAFSRGSTALQLGSSSDRIHWGSLPAFRNEKQEPCVRGAGAPAPVEQVSKKEVN